MDVLFIVDPLSCRKRREKTEMQKITKEKPYFTESTLGLRRIHTIQKKFNTPTQRFTSRWWTSLKICHVSAALPAMQKNFSSIPILEQYSNNNGKVTVPTLEI
jgi:hypothetical protein